MSSHRAHTLVTGGAGFIGSHVVDKLIAAGVRPKVFDLVPSPYLLNGSAEIVVGDLLDPGALRAAMAGCDTVVHLAAMADADEVARRPADAERVNSEGTLNVLEAARDTGVSRVVYASTIWAYSDVDEPFVDEDTPLVAPSHLYTATKLAGEMYCRAYGELYGLDFTILRFGIPYGPRARPAAVVPTFVGKAMAGEPLTLSGDGSQSRRFVYVEDLAEGVVQALAPCAANRVYNLVSGQDVTIKEVADAVAAQVGDTQIVHVPGRAADFRGVEVCGKRAERELGWRASTPFAEGVARYVDWHRTEYAEDAKTAAGVPPANASSALVRRLGAVNTRVPLVLGVAAMVLIFIAGVDSDATRYADSLRTIAITSLLGLVFYAALTSEPDTESGSVVGLSRMGWLLAGGLLALALRGSYNPLHLVHPDLQLVLLSTIGAALGVGTGASGRRLLRERLRERPSDTSG